MEDNKAVVLLCNLTDHSHVIIPNGPWSKETDLYLYPENIEIMEYNILHNIDIPIHYH